MQYSKSTGSLPSKARRWMMRQALNSAPYPAIKGLRHAMAFPFLTDSILPQKPQLVQANSKDRDAFWQYSLDRFGADMIDYFEFGVHRGAATRYFTSANTNPASRFYGFDSFEGLPEDWRGGMAAGHFDTGGVLPDIDDPRLTFVPGFFSRSLPPFFERYEANPDADVVVLFDADLYSSTICAMTWIIVTFPGRRMLWMFDELLNEELAAFETMVGAHDLPFQCLATSADYMRTSFVVG